MYVIMIATLVAQEQDRSLLARAEKGVGRASTPSLLSRTTGRLTTPSCVKR